VRATEDEIEVTEMTAEDMEELIFPGDLPGELIIEFEGGPTLRIEYDTK
jgi:hypothetical protein